MTLPAEKVLAILNLFIEGTSVRSTARLTGVHREHDFEGPGSGWREVRKVDGPLDCERSGEGR